MSILITYATTEGQTRKIARRAASHIAARGLAVELMAVGEASDIRLADYQGAILLASVHGGKYQSEFVEFATARQADLDAIPTAFLSVSLSAASKEREDLEGIAEVVRKFEAETGWVPGVVEHVAGAFRFTQYDFLKSWAMRWIAARRDPDADPTGNTEYTDWDGLYRFLDGWIEGLNARSA